MASRLLIVRLGALGDIVHAVPVLAALRRHDPSLQIDWLVDAACAPMLDCVPGLHRRIIVRRRRRGSAPIGKAEFEATAAGYVRAVAYLRRQRYHVAMDLQGLLKSALWARLSGATRVIGFSRDHLRERQASWFYSETVTPPTGVHVVRKNLAMAEALGASPDLVEVPLRGERSGAVEAVRSGAPYAVINPGAAWPNKRWPAARFGAVARHLHERHQLRAVVTYGPGEQGLADALVAASGGAATLAPPTRIGELVALMEGARLVVSGDTGPLHMAAATGAPIVGLFGPTWPARNGPWNPADVVVSRADVCRCHHKRHCLVGAPCIESISVDEVTAAVDRRLAQERVSS